MEAERVLTLPIPCSGALAERVCGAAGPPVCPRGRGGLGTHRTPRTRRRTRCGWDSTHTLSFFLSFFLFSHSLSLSFFLSFLSLSLALFLSFFLFSHSRSRSRRPSLSFFTYLLLLSFFLFLLVFFISFCYLSLVLPLLSRGFLVISFSSCKHLRILFHSLSPDYMSSQYGYLYFVLTVFVCFVCFVCTFLSYYISLLSLMHVCILSFTIF